MTFYLIRHKTTNLFMPQLRRGRGYSHWNPPHEVLQKQNAGVPRLFPSRRNAQNAISQWFANPNAYRSYSQDYNGEVDDIVDNKKDDRKKEDLEVVEVEVELP